MSGANRHEISWVAQGKAGDVLSALVGCLTREPGTSVASSGTDWAEIARGSRTSLRQLGFLTPKRSVPIRARMVVGQLCPDTTAVSVEAWSDPGLYSFKVSFLASRIFRRAIADLFKTLQSCTVQLPSPVPGTIA
jgi:hypothetical protein